MLVALTKPNMDTCRRRAHPGLAREKTLRPVLCGIISTPWKSKMKTASWTICPRPVDDAKLKLAVETLLGKYPHEVVAVYLNAFNDMNAAGWANLKALLETDTRLQLGNHA